ncbi:MULTISPECIES: molecular chaperone DnaJ [Rhodococcus]|uniref:Chaperone protein DnaJ n=1 Tax=Rhodococcus oxybenzonivorans TaxID=1990687 RepID=A0AAE4UVM0_9NOCA|nr:MULTISPECIES: molecular chaperone DnaJ [Rhodococcus]MDV7244317.1 molecular chaperone DnaJ [Rhodococcus oxybenzonivorans]MDV7263524.1 molecular chaperone DnaJ [Rhodococcus oxybenzonivorans]MDV7274441.1 molecular chaperone DnaJ [Rhodococcus oxybenzonivorans]MDV7335754.1 molecular chaperone DnaJ [Rhodococcus oxybenzonivorans]MDV7345391.1 molecular chaperone DnaJ [Rhodococcus oxybenzonivorans]
MARDYYATLGVDQKATDQELKRAYRKLARELHPDVNPDESAQARFREISTAYEVLSDPEKRRIVDLGGDPLSSGGGAGAGFGGGFGGGLGDVFEAFFGGGGGAGRGPRGRVQPGADSLLRTRLTLAECATGVSKQVAVETAILCDSCTGSGTNGNSKPVRCETCGGAGEVQSVQRSFLGQVMTSRPCPTCRGAGETIPDPCHKCGGDGRVRARRDITVKVPAGVAGGMRIRLAAQGEVGPGGGPAGDLYVEVVEQAHEVFVRDGEDLHCTVRVPMVDAALGTTVTIDTIIDGPKDIVIEPGTQPGSVTVLRGHGMPKLRSGVRGDVHAHLEVVVPSRLDHKEAKLLRELRDLRDRDVAEVVSTQSQHSGGLFSRLREAFSGR